MFPSIVCVTSSVKRIQFTLETKKSNKIQNKYVSRSTQTFAFTFLFSMLNATKYHLCKSLTLNMAAFHNHIFQMFPNVPSLHLQIVEQTSEGAARSTEIHQTPDTRSWSNNTGPKSALGNTIRLQRD